MLTRLVDLKELNKGQKIFMFIVVSNKIQA